jgi:GT2 family glycosyltransferase
VDPGLKVIEERRCSPRRDTLLDFLLFRNLPAFASCVVVRREWFEALGGFGTDLVILSDWDMACRLARAGTIRSVAKPLVLYRQYPNNQSRDVRIHLWSGVRSLRRFFSHPALDPRIRRRQRDIWARFYAMLAGGYLRNGDWARGFRWLLKALATSPAVAPYAAGMPIRRAFRSLAPVRGLSFANGQGEGETS